MKGKYEYVVVGSGAGGATVARELAKRKKSVLVLEAGHRDHRLGRLRSAAGYYDANRLTFLLRESREGVGIFRALMAGGSTVVSCGNGVRCLEKEFRELGVDLSKEFEETEKELQVASITPRLYSNGSRALIEAGRDLGYAIEPMPKFIDQKACRKCGECVLGCVHGAKWTSLNYLDEALASGAELLCRAKVTQVITDRAKAAGVRALTPEGQKGFGAGAVILAAGGIGTPVILQNSGIKDAGGNLFVDLLVDTFGITDQAGLNNLHEPSMTFVDLEFHKSKGFILSTAEHTGGMMKYVRCGVRSLLDPDSRMMSMMTKITDEPAGRVFPDGSISKPVTKQDRSRLEEGSSICKEIMRKAGAKRFGFSRIGGGHPGGTAALGKVVDRDLQTEVEGLFVADSSVFPQAPGLPPILTIVALAKHLAKALP